MAYDAKKLYEDARAAGNGYRAIARLLAEQEADYLIPEDDSKHGSVNLAERALLDAYKDGEAARYTLSSEATQQRCNELLEEARAARRATADEHAHVMHLQDDKIKLQQSVIFHLEELALSRAEAEDLGKKLKAAYELLDRAATFARRISLRFDNPPRWTEEAEKFSAELEEAIK